MGAWQSHSTTSRLVRRFTPRNDTLLNAFMLVHTIIIKLYGWKLKKYGCTSSLSDHFKVAIKDLAHFDSVLL
jgi:hypothetical protein